MPEKQKVYCGKQPVLPEGYDRFAIPYQCLKKGYGACLYANRRGTCGGSGNNNHNDHHGPPRYEQHYFHRVFNRIMFLLMIVVLFMGLCLLFNKFFSEE